MFPELIRPVVEKIRPILTHEQTIFSRRLTFPTPPELGITIYVDCSGLASQVGVSLNEINEPEKVAININTYPHLGYQDFVRASTFFQTKGVLEQRTRTVIELPPTHPLFNKYAVEKPGKLCRVEGARYRFIVGEKPESVFVDGWIKKAQAPSWRVCVPMNTTDQTFELLILDSRLLIFG